MAYLWVVLSNSYEIAAIWVSLSMVMSMCSLSIDRFYSKRSRVAIDFAYLFRKVLYQRNAEALFTNHRALGVAVLYCLFLFHWVFYFFLFIWIFFFSNCYFTFGPFLWMSFHFQFVFIFSIRLSKSCLLLFFLICDECSSLFGIHVSQIVTT